MKNEVFEAIALQRHQIISPVLMDEGRVQWAYFKQMSEREFEVPGRGLRKFSAATMKAWLYRYKKNGFVALMPKSRTDSGTCRAFSPSAKIEIKTLRQDFLNESVAKFYSRCQLLKYLGAPPVCMETFRRFLRLEGLYVKKILPVPRKRFEMRYFGELWTCDFMHGPQVEVEGLKKTKKSILLAIIDDHSRFIVGYKWSITENTLSLEDVFKNAILTHGLPDRLYCDNGSAFSSHYLKLTCAHLNIGLVHSKPYDSPSRGKIERFFRTVREQFLTDFKPGEVLTLDLINQKFEIYIRHYHERSHRGIDTEPFQRYQQSIRSYPRKRINEDDLEEHFLVTCERRVSKDATISLLACVLEVPPQFIGKRVVIKYSQKNMSQIFLYDQGIRVQKLKPVDTQINGQIYKPSPRISEIALHELNNKEETT